MIYAATGAIALVIAPVARQYGIDYLIATVILAGAIQVLGVFGVAKLMRFIPRCVEPQRGRPQWPRTATCGSSDPPLIGMSGCFVRGTLNGNGAGRGRCHAKGVPYDQSAEDPRNGGSSGTLVVGRPWSCGAAR
jgi:hypothetical protein